MKKVDEVGLLKFGNTIQLVGAIFQGEETNYLLLLPGETAEQWTEDLEVEDWEAFMRQLDLQETEVLTQAKDGKIVKSILRKSARQVDTRIAWKVYRRDGFKCRYCGTKDMPLSVDHLVTWEEGGPTIEANLVAACRKCNRVRGNLDYEEWLNSRAYAERSTQLSSDDHLKNAALIDTLKDIPRRLHRVKR